MKLLYHPVSGRIHYNIPDHEWFFFDPSLSAGLELMEIDEVEPDNRPLCNDIFHTATQRDANGNMKYYVQDGVLMARDNWTPIPYP